MTNLRVYYLVGMDEAQILKLNVYNDMNVDIHEVGEFDKEFVELILHL